MTVLPVVLVVPVPLVVPFYYMKKFGIQAILLIIVITIALFLYKDKTRFPDLPFLAQKPVFGKVFINNVELKVEIADTPARRSKGLSDRQSLASDEGMLFIFPKPDKYPFWMKGLTYPLDFIWIKGGRVVDLLQNIQPPAPGQSDELLPIYQTKEDIDKVLEVAAGTAQRLNIKAGDTIKIE